MTCIHSDTGLCPDCQADYDVDPLAWLEFGLHTEGIARWNTLRAEIAAQEPDEPIDWTDVPF